MQPSSVAMKGDIQKWEKQMQKNKRKQSTKAKCHCLHMPVAAKAFVAPEH